MKEELKTSSDKVKFLNKEVSKSFGFDQRETKYKDAIKKLEKQAADAVEKAKKFAERIKELENKPAEKNQQQEADYKVQIQFMTDQWERKLKEKDAQIERGQKSMMALQTEHAKCDQAKAKDQTTIKTLEQYV